MANKAQVSLVESETAESGDSAVWIHIQCFVLCEISVGGLSGNCRICLSFSTAGFLFSDCNGSGIDICANGIFNEL